MKNKQFLWVKGFGQMAILGLNEIKPKSDKFDEVSANLWQNV